MELRAHAPYNTSTATSFIKKKRKCIHVIKKRKMRHLKFFEELLRGQYASRRLAAHYHFFFIIWDNYIFFFKNIFTYLFWFI